MKEMVILRSRKCEWCDDVMSMLHKLDRKVSSVKISENKIAEALSKKECGGDSCLLVDGKSFRRIDKGKIRELLLD